MWGTLGKHADNLCETVRHALTNVGNRMFTLGKQLAHPLAADLGKPGRLQGFPICVHSISNILSSLSTGFYGFPKRFQTVITAVSMVSQRFRLRDILGPQMRSHKLRPHFRTGVSLREANARGLPSWSMQTNAIHILLSGFL